MFNGVPVPVDFICPITLEIMEQPVVLEDGFSYSKDAIEKWLRNHDTSPSTGAQLYSRSYVPNRALHSSIEAFLAQNRKRDENLKKGGRKS